MNRYAVMGATVEQVRSVGGSDIKEARATGIIFANLTKEQADRLRAMGCQVAEVGHVQATVTPPIVAPPVPVAAIPLYTPSQLISVARFDEVREIVSPPIYGEGANIAVVDSGIRESHEQIRGRVVYSKNFTADPMGDSFNHGTGVCSIITTVAPQCNILNIKVLNDKGEGTEEDVVLGIDHLLTLYDEGSEFRPDVINMSLGAPDDGNPNNILRVACRAAVDRDIWVLASAGNAGPTPSIMNPACERYVCALGACRPEPLEICEWSSRGPTVEGLTKPDIVFFGENIEVASSASDTAVVGKSGTSFSTPFISGAGALYHDAINKIISIQTEQYPEYTELIVEAWERSFTFKSAFDTLLPRIGVKPQGAPLGKDYDYGYGLPFGPLMAQSLTQPTVTIPDIVTPVIGLGLIGMVGIVISSMMKGVLK